MSIYARTSLKAGPFRFNLSKSGMSISTGVPGFRIVASPRGNYVRIGSKGLSYRATIPIPAGTPLPHYPRGSATSKAPDPHGGVVFESITGLPVSDLVPVSPSDLIVQLRAVVRRTAVAPLVAIPVLVLSLFLGAFGILLILLAAPVVTWLVFRDRARRSVVVFYDLEDSVARRFAALAAAVEQMARTQRFWFVSAAGQINTTYQHKVNSGASTLVERKRATVDDKGPRELVTNITVPSLRCGAQSVYFLPDRVLVRDGRAFADMPYGSLLATGQPFRFIESDHVPSDSRQVDTTWKYVNVNGGPDRRFKDNHRLPVMLYGRLTLSTPGGLHLVWDCSRPEAVSAVTDVLRAAAASWPQA